MDAPGPIPVGARFRVRVPATSANLGSGFDALGLALDLWDTYTVQATDRSGQCAVTIHGEGAGSVSEDDANLVVATMRAAAAAAGRQLPGFSLRCDNRIPHGRGLGSSAAAIVGGILAGRALAGLARDPGVELALAARLEGHPDNVAAALLGGHTIAWWGPDAAAPQVSAGPAVASTDDAAGAAGSAAATGGADGADGADGAGGIAGVGGGARPMVAHAVRLAPVAVCLRAYIPPAAMSTTLARGLLPATVPHADAAHAAGRSALVVAALTAAQLADRSRVLLAATEDRLHQAPRGLAMPVTAGLLARLRGAGVAAVLSGSGPSVLVIGAAAHDRERWAAVEAPTGWTIFDTGVADGACVGPVEVAGAPVEVAAAPVEARPAGSPTH